MQPPPRKGNYTKFLKNLHTEQINKLVLKNQHECDLLEDIRTFTIKRSAIEKSYSEALLKISSAYLNKKMPNIPDMKMEGGDEKWNMWSVWRTVLEENEKLARARLAAVEVFHQQISDDAKILRTYKLQAAKKSIDQLATVHKELQTCVQDLDKTKKFYFEEEHSARDVRDKARDIEEKLKKKKGSFFTSRSSLQKNSAKVTSRRDQLDEKSTGARNDYLFCLASANAHQNRYFVVDLQLCMTTMESGVYDKIAEYLNLMGRTELLTCSAMQHSYGVIRDQARQLTRDYNLQCCYLYYPILKQHIQYEFEACDNDPVAVITAPEHDAATVAELAKEARRLAGKIARETNTIRESVRQLQMLNALRDAGQRVDPMDPNGPDVDTKFEEVRQMIRRSETAKCKAEARIEYLRLGGFSVDEYLQEAEALNVQDIQRSTSSLSDHPSSESFYDSDFAEAEAPAPSADRPDSADSNKGIQEQFEIDAMIEADRHRAEDISSGWEDPTNIDWGIVTELPEDAEENGGDAGSTTTLLKCTALYSYTAQNPDELTIVENEQLEVVGEGDGDGWCRARNYKGEEGYVPQNYLDIEQPVTSTPGVDGQISFSSVDYTVSKDDTVDNIVSEAEIKEFEDLAMAEDLKPASPPVEEPPSLYCCAVYDYDGEGDEELTFDEGQLIRIISKIAHSIDDGWWRGELEGKIGNFPSLVVEECNEFGQPLKEHTGNTPPQSAPPIFTPPEAPSPTSPIEDYLPQESPPRPDVSETDINQFKMALSQNQQQQYGRQFNGESKEPLSEEDVPAVEVTIKAKEVPLSAIKKPESATLGVAQIVITAATPMKEEADLQFPDVKSIREESGKEVEDFDDEPSDSEEDDEEGGGTAIVVAIEEPVEEDDGTIVISKQILEECPPIETPPSAGSSGTGSQESETTEASTTDNNSVVGVPTVPPPPPPPGTAAEDNVEQNDSDSKQVVAGRASIPDELEPHQLVRLQQLKESNA